jgi:hypothetical protein
MWHGFGDRPMSIRPDSRAKFEKQGVFLTKRNLEMENMDGPEQLEAVSWLAEQERFSKRRDCVQYGLMLLFTIIAAVSAMIAAWPVVKDWLVK